MKRVLILTSMLMLFTTGVWAGESFSGTTFCEPGSAVSFDEKDAKQLSVLLKHQKRIQALEKTYLDTVPKWQFDLMIEKVNGLEKRLEKLEKKLTLQSKAIGNLSVKVASKWE